MEMRVDGRECTDIKNDKNINLKVFYYYISKLCFVRIDITVVFPFYFKVPLHKGYFNEFFLPILYFNKTFGIHCAKGGTYLRMWHWVNYMPNILCLMPKQETHFAVAHQPLDHFRFSSKVIEIQLP